MKSASVLFYSRTLKSVFSAALALLLCFALLPAGVADSDIAPDNIAEGFFCANSLAVLDGKLYCASFDGIYVVSADNGEITPVYYFSPDELQPDVIFVWRGALCGLNSNTGAMYRYDISGAPSEMLIELNTTSINRDEGYFLYSEPLFAPFVCGDLLYATTQTEDYGVFVTHRWQLSTGQELSPISMENLYCALPYPDGRLLLVCRDIVSYYDLGDRQTTAYAYLYDESTGASEQFATLSGFEVSAFAMDGEKLYYLCDSTIYELSRDSFPRAVNYVTVLYPDAATAAAAFGGGYYVSGRTRLLCRSILPDAEMNTTLRVASFNFGDTHTKAAALTDAVELIVYPQQYGIEETIAAIRDGSADTDVYLITADADMAGILASGALEPLGSESLSDFVLSCAEPIRSLGTYGGKAYALPVSVYPSGGMFGLRYTDEELELVGLSESDIPTNLMDALDFITAWCEESAPDHPEVFALKVYDKTTFMLGVVEAYIYSCAAAGEAPDFHCDAFRSLMEKGKNCLTALTAAGMVYQESASQSALEDYWSKLELFDLTDYDAFEFSGGYYSPTKYIPLPLTTGAKPVFPVTVDLLFINPNTAHMKEALEYAEAYLSAMDEDSLTRLTPDTAKPVLNPDYDEYIAETENAIADIDAQLPTASARDRRELAERRKTMERVLDNREACQYLISSSDIASYSFAISHAVSESVVGSFEMDEISAIERYFMGAITFESLADALQ